MKIKASNNKENSNRIRLRNRLTNQKRTFKLTFTNGTTKNQEIKFYNTIVAISYNIEF